MSTLWIFQVKALKMQYQFCTDTILIYTTHYHRYNTFYYSTSTIIQTKPYLCILTMKLSPSPWGPPSWRKSKPWKSIGVIFIKEEVEVDESENLAAKLFQFGSPDWRSQKVDPGPALCVNKSWVKFINWNRNIQTFWQLFDMWDCEKWKYFL